MVTSRRMRAPICSRFVSHCSEALWGYPFDAAKGPNAALASATPTAIRAVVQRGCAVRAEDRLASMSELLAALQRARHGPRRGRVWLLGAGAVATTIALGGFVA